MAALAQNDQGAPRHLSAIRSHRVARWERIQEQVMQATRRKHSHGTMPQSTDEAVAFPIKGTQMELRGVTSNYGKILVPDQSL
jgi:hypothetical protein